MFESISYFIKYLIPLALSSITVLLLTYLNHVISPVLWRGRVADPMEVLAYSILFIGPFAFALSFIFYFYGIELLKEQWSYAKIAFISAAVLIAIGIVLDLAFIPKLK